MANSREPYVEGHRIDTSVSTTVSDSRVNVYVGIEADTGTYDLTYQQTPKVFVQEYSTKAKPDTNDASTLLHAGKLVENFGIYVKRVNKDSILPGIVSTNKYGEVGFFDTSYNLIKNLTEFKIDQAVSEVTEQKLAMVIDNVLYVNVNMIDSETKKLISDFDAEFDTAPVYYKANGTTASISEAVEASDVDLTGIGAHQVAIVENEGTPNEMTNYFYVINLGEVYNSEKFLDKASEYAKNYRSNLDKSEFIGYDKPSLMISMDISAWDDSDVEAINACKTLKNSSRLAKALTKIEFTEGSEDESLLTNTPFYKEGDGIKYLDIGGYRYFPQILNDTFNYADITVTAKPSNFAGNPTPFTKSEVLPDGSVKGCTVSDGILSSIDTMITENDTVKPDSAYCSTDQVFALKIGDQDEGIVLIPSKEIVLEKADDTSVTQTIKLKTGAYGEGFDTKLVQFFILDINGNWKEFIGDTPIADQYIDQAGYAYIKIKFDGEVNDVSDVTAGLSFLYQDFTSTQESEESDTQNEVTNHMFVLGKNVDVTDFIPEGYVIKAGQGLVVDNIEIKNVSPKTTDLGLICSLPYVNFSGKYHFDKVSKAEEAPSAPLITFMLDENNALIIDTEGSVLNVNAPSSETISIESSRINKLYLYFLNNRNVTFGITGYNEKCWKKYSTVLQRNYTFESQDSISAGIPGYHAIQVKDTIYYNGILNDKEGRGPVVDVNVFDYENEVQVSTVKLTALEFIDALDEKLRNNFKLIAKMNDGCYVIGEPIQKSEIHYTDGLAIKEFMPVNQEEDFSNARYAIIQKFTSAAKLFSIDLSFDKVDNEIIRFVNSYNGTEYTDRISFNVGKIDGYGTNISYKSYNLFDGRSFFIKELNEEAPVIEMKVSSFGDDIKPKKATSSDYVNALDDLVTDEFKPSFLWDAGLCQVDYYNAMTKLAETTYSMVPMSTPKSAESYSDIAAWKSAFNVDNATQYILDGWHYNTVFGDISFECCPTYYYLVNILSNANSITKEFQPMFYKTRGIVSAGVPLRNIPLTKDEREKLLDLRVNSIVRNKANSISYINQNFTNQQVTSDFSEEQNVRISNEVCRSADSYADNNIISKNNTSNLRAQVTSELTNILRARILDSRGDDTAHSFYVECNDVNNPKAIIDARKLVIDVYVTYNKSINAVLVYSRTKSLDQG